MDTERELIELTQQLLESIAGGDWETYARLCDPSLSAFEPESSGQLVEGLMFHKYFFDLGRAGTPHNTTPVRAACPHARQRQRGCELRQAESSRWTAAALQWCGALKRRGCGSGSRASGNTCISTAPSALESGMRQSHLAETALKLEAIFQHVDVDKIAGRPLRLDFRH